MAYFPLFLDLSGKTVLIVGGGPVAARKARVLLDYGPRVLVCAPRFVPQLEELSGGGAAAAALCPGAVGGGLPGSGRHGRPGAQPHRLPALPGGGHPRGCGGQPGGEHLSLPRRGPPGAAVGGDLQRRKQPHRLRLFAPGAGARSPSGARSHFGLAGGTAGGAAGLPPPGQAQGRVLPNSSTPLWRRSGL